LPTYEYACRSCGEHLEAVQSFRDDPLTTCPSCGGQLRKVFGSIGIAFKGSGFYRTDSRAAAGASSRRNGESGEKAEAKPEAKGESKGDAKAEAKDTKSEPKAAASS
jgi:putative FmdB family regulatory protein